MKSQIKVIRFVAIMSIVLAAVTYLITVNIETGFVSFNTPWLSNNFLLTVCGGAFASMLVVLLCEIQKYIDAKKTVEDCMFDKVAYVYIQLAVSQRQIQSMLKDPNEIVPKDILTPAVVSLRDNLVGLKDIEYCTFWGHGKIEKDFSKFRENTVHNIIRWCACENYLKMAVNYDQIDNLKLSNTVGRITSASPNTNCVLMKLDLRLESLIVETDQFLQSMDNCCKNRFVWSLRKVAMQIGMEHASTEDYDSFVK